MKKFILSLFVGFVGIISFCSADFTNTLYCNNGCISTFNFQNISDFKIVSDMPARYMIECYSSVFGSSRDYSITVQDGVYLDSSINCSNYASNTFSYQKIINVKLLGCDGGSCNLTYTYYDFLGCSCPECPTCPTCDPQYTSEQCQSVYGLVSSGLLNTCENNYNNCQLSLNSCQSNTSGFNDQLNNCNLSLNACNSSLTNCLQYNCPEVDYTGDLLRSNIYINNILHPGRQFVNIEIPDYIQWDYSVGDDDFNLYVGSGYDVDYIESVIDINSYRPTSEDFTNVFVSGLTLIFPYIFVALLIIFIRKLVKRIFK